MIITGSIIGGISFGIQAFNSWSNERNAQRMRDAQEAYQRAALIQNLDEAKRLFQSMLSTKREIMTEERENQLEIMREQHQENLRTIEYLTSLDKWPLAVHPLVMRNDSLFYQQSDENSIIPINVILGPCRDRNFQTAIWKQVEDELALRFTTYWNTSGSHPILFYQDAWKDDRDQADSAMCANIRAKTRFTPTVILSPVLTNKGLLIEMTHWCVDGKDAKTSFKNGIQLSLAGTCHQYKKEEEFDDTMIGAYVKELADLIESIIGYLDDQYMWLRYNTLPQFPGILQNRLYIDNAGRALIYRQYVEMLQSSLENGHIDVVMDLKLVLAYCIMIDLFGEGHLAFDVVIKAFYGNKQLTDLRRGTPAYETEKLETFLIFCKENRKTIELRHDVYHDMRWGFSLIKLCNDWKTRFLTDDRYLSKTSVKRHVFQGPFIRHSCKDLEQRCNEAATSLIDRCRRETDSSVDRRNWCRPQFEESLKSIISSTIEKLISDIDSKLLSLVELVANDCLQLTWNIHQQDRLLGITDCGEDIISDDEARELLTTTKVSISKFARSRVIAGDHDYWKRNYMRQSIDGRLEKYCDSVLTAWIDYHFMREDTIHETISDEAIHEIKVKMDAICVMIEAVADGYLDLLLSNTIKKNALN